MKLKLEPCSWKIETKDFGWFTVEERKGAGFVTWWCNISSDFIDYLDDLGILEDSAFHDSIEEVLPWCEKYLKVVEEAKENYIPNEWKCQE